MNNFPSFCVDNFYSNPDDIRALALAEIKDNPIDVKGIYPGIRSRQLKEINKDLYNQFCYKFFSIFYDLRTSKIQWVMDTSFQLIEPFSTNKDSPRNRGWIHLDERVICGGVVYLTPDIEPSTGTSMFRLDNPETLNKSNDKKEYYETGIFRPNYDTELEKHNNSFTETARYNNIYNRLIGFDSSTWHGVNSYYTTKEPRLIQVFFVHLLNRETQTPILRSKVFDSPA